MKRLAQQAAQAYFDRWGVETFFLRVKQDYLRPSDGSLHPAEWGWGGRDAIQMQYNTLLSPGQLLKFTGTFELQEPQEMLHDEQ